MVAYPWHQFNLLIAIHIDLFHLGIPKFVLSKEKSYYPFFAKFTDMAPVATGT